MMTKLKKMRESRGLSQSELAKKAGIHLRTLQHYEQGVLDFSHCKMDKIFRAAIVLDCDVEDLIEDENMVSTIKQYQNS